MKLEEAIKHCEEVAILNENTCKAKPDSNLKKYKKCAEEHRQLAEWLKDYKRLLDQQPCEDCISRANALRVAKNEYLRGWHNALCKALSEKYSIHCEEGNLSVIQEETITGLGLSMDCAVGKDVESYMSTIPSVTPKGVTVTDFADKCRECGKQDTVSRESYEHEYFLRKEFDFKIAKLEKAIEALEQEPVLEKVRADIIKYECNCRLSVDEYPTCKQCTDNVFESIYGIIDKYKAESEVEHD